MWQRDTHCSSSGGAVCTLVTMNKPVSGSGSYFSKKWVYFLLNQSLKCWTLICFHCPHIYLVLTCQDGKKKKKNPLRHQVGWHQVAWHQAAWHQVRWHQAGWHQAGWPRQAGVLQSSSGQHQVGWETRTPLSRPHSASSAISASDNSAFCKIQWSICDMPSIQKEKLGEPLPTGGRTSACKQGPV